MATSGKTRIRSVLAKDVADQRQRVEVLLLVGVILNADQVVAEIVEDAGDLDGAVGVAS